MARLREHYTKNVLPELMKEFGYKNIMAVPKIEKISLNIGLGEATGNPKLMDGAVNELGQIAGQLAGTAANFIPVVGPFVSPMVNTAVSGAVSGQGVSGEQLAGAAAQGLVGGTLAKAAAPVTPNAPDTSTLA